MKIGSSYRDIVGVEQFSSNWDWSWNDWLTILIIPTLFLVSFISIFPQEIVPYLDTSIRCLGFLLLSYLNYDLLKIHWKAFCKRLGTGIFIVISFCVLMQVVFSITKFLVPHANTLVDEFADKETNYNFMQLLFFSLGPIAIVLIEEFTFRHTLLFKIPIWKSKPIFIVFVVLINSLIFGLLHIYNVGGNLILTLPFVAVGLLMNLLYIYTRNIWHVLLSHGLNNFILGGPITILIAYLLGADM